MSFIVCCEGADGAGKATQTKLLAEKLGGTRFAFPNYSSPTGKAILGHLKSAWWATATVPLSAMKEEPRLWWRENEKESDKLDPLVFQALQTVNRIEQVAEINAALEKGPVIYDRFSASAMIYGGLDGLDVKWIEKINAPLPQPDVWIYLDIPIEESFKRRPERRDRYESDRAYLERVRGGYLTLFATPPAHAREVPPRKDRWEIVDGMGTVEEVHARIMEIFAKSCVTAGHWFGDDDRCVSCRTPKPLFPSTCFCVEGRGPHITNAEGRCATCGEIFK